MFAKFLPNLNGLLLIIGGGTAAFNAYAADPDCFANDGMAESRNYLSSSFQWENDIGNSDRWYTNGMKYSRTKNLECNSDFLDNALKPEDSKSVFLSAWLGGMNMYTPQVITIPGPQPFDRPWTGWAYLGREWKSVDITTDAQGNYTPGDSDRLEIDLGVLGAWAHQGNVQRGWHSLIGAQTPQGWGNEKKGEIGASVAYTKQKRLSFNNFDTSARAGFIVGNVVNQINFGIGFNYTTERLILDDPTYLPIAFLSGPKQISPAVTLKSMATERPTSTREKWYSHSSNFFFADLEGKVFASSTFISGTSVIMKPLVLDAKFGWAHKFANSDYTLRLSRLVRSPEFQYPAGGNAPWQKIWQLSLEWDWGVVRNPYVK